MAADRFACAASLPTFLAESRIADGAFSAGRRLEVGPQRAHQLRYLASHRYGIVPGKQVFACPDGSLNIALEVALSIIQRGILTLPSYRVETELVERAKKLGWHVNSLLPPRSGDLRKRLQDGPSDQDFANVFTFLPDNNEHERGEVLAWICARIDRGSPGEEQFVREVLARLPLALLCVIEPQRDLISMGADSQLFVDQRVDFAVETADGKRLVVEIDGSQHSPQSGQGLLDAQRDTALRQLGWTTLRIPTDKIGQPGFDYAAMINAFGYAQPPDDTAERNVHVAALFWGSTAVTRIQSMIVESMLDGAVAADRPIRVAINEYQTDVAELAVSDLNRFLHAVGSLYDAEVPRCDLANDTDGDLLIDVDVLYPQRAVPSADMALAWSRPAARACDTKARPIAVGPGSPRHLPRPPDEAVLDELVRDLFRKDGLLRDPNTGHSDQADVAKRVLQGQDVIALLPTGAGKSLPYMLAGLLLPGMTLYVGPLVSLLQDQAERLRTLGISHVEYLSSAQDHHARETALKLVQSQGVRFLLVSPERFLTVAFLTALKNRQLTGGDISQVVVDECHCVSEWGHEFRPAYLSLGRIAKDRSARFGTSAPLVGLTGTASTIVLSDVLRELGIGDPNACVRASNLDRPELTFHCTPVFQASNREEQVEHAVREALQQYTGSMDGILVFCPFRGGRSIGVFSVAAHLSNQLPGVDVRFFCGGSEPWADYAVFALHRRRNQLDRDQVRGSIPAWARRPDGVRPWNEVKSLVQRDYISGTPRSYRVLVATKAFGMGIDKPSIRKIIHAVAPTSPEAYYQEIGRAGRDRQPAHAELFFCDVNPAVTDQILDLKWTPKSGQRFKL